MVSTVVFAQLTLFVSFFGPIFLLTEKSPMPISYATTAPTSVILGAYNGDPHCLTLARGVSKFIVVVCPQLHIMVLQPYAKQGDKTFTLRTLDTTTKSQPR